MSAPARRSAESLVQEREFLLTSLRDLETERSAGDVTEEDYEALRARYTERAAATLRDIEALGTARPVRRRSGFRAFLGRRRTRWFLGIAGTAFLAAGVFLAAASVAGVRLPGQSASGSVSIPLAQRVAEQIVEANAFANAHEFASAIELYDTVLAEVPHQADALTYRGWLERLAGLKDHSPRAVAAGDASMREAMRVAPGYADARALYGVALLEDRHDRTGALVEFRAFLADHPAKSRYLLSDLGAEMATAFGEAHEAVPAALVPYESARAKTPS